jgi:hypothetical protein
VNPKLLPLANNGGFTQTHLPLLDSPVINKGTGSGANSEDQRGVGRPQGVASDIGAVEVRVFEPCLDTPPSPDLLKPKPDAFVKKNIVLFDWDDTPCASKYKLNIQTVGSAQVTVWNFKGLAYSRHEVSTLIPGKTYRWRVQACNGGKCGKSGWRIFELE